MSTHRQTVTLSEPQAAYLKNEAGLLGISMSDLVRRMIDKERAAHPFDILLYPQLMRNMERYDLLAAADNATTASVAKLFMDEFEAQTAEYILKVRADYDRHDQNR